MTEQKDNPETQSADDADELLRQLFHLKRYEVPETARMMRNKQNIMRRVREADGKVKWRLSDLLEMNVPWFFAEPRYGIAALFVIFATLQFWGVSAQRPLEADSSIYGPGRELATADVNIPIYTNSITYPKMPEDLKLFPVPDQQGNGDVRFVGRIEPKK